MRCLAISLNLLWCLQDRYSEKFGQHNWLFSFFQSIDRQRGQRSRVPSPYFLLPRNQPSGCSAGRLGTGWGSKAGLRCFILFMGTWLRSSSDFWRGFLLIEMSICLGSRKWEYYREMARKSTPGMRRVSRVKSWWRQQRRSRWWDVSSAYILLFAYLSSFPSVVWEFLSAKLFLLHIPACLQDTLSTSSLSPWLQDIMSTLCVVVHVCVCMFVRSCVHSCIWVYVCLISLLIMLEDSQKPHDLCGHVWRLEELTRFVFHKVFTVHTSLPITKAKWMRSQQN